jgi:pSer/pThr/pTyr-binding forkhead associated (FHA) protein
MSPMPAEGATPAAVEVWSLSGRTHLTLVRDRMTIGKDAGNDVPIDSDPTISRLHAVLERFPAGWCVTDLGSSNGTFVNGERIWSAQRLRHGDEIRLGRTRLLFRNSADVGRSQTAVEEGPPVLTTREREVLALLCRPLLDRDLFTEPATVREIATELVVSEAAVKQHLVNLYAKFGVRDSAVHRRSRLANEAIRRGAITLSELRREPD